jgi:hypothetical protein
VGGETRTVVIRPDGTQVITVIGRDGQLLRRIRRDDRGRESSSSTTAIATRARSAASMSICRRRSFASPTIDTSSIPRMPGRI